MTGRRSFVVKTARVLQSFPLAWLRPVESLFLRARSCGPPRMVFLMGLPRSGSTLTYQALVQGLQPLYLSNFWNLFYDLPYMGGLLSVGRCAGYESDFRSAQGFVGGVCGPAEGLRFWSYWTGCGLDETSKPLVSERRLVGRLGYFGRVMAALTSSEVPMVTGYLGHALVPQRLRVWFPEAIFVRLHRDPLSNAASILRSRQAASGEWFSVFPSECQEALGQGVHAEVAAQVYWLNRRLALLDGDSGTIHVRYEELCENPRAVLDRVVDGCNARGLAIAVRNSLPEAFEYRVASPGDDVDTALLARELERLEAENGPIRW